MRTTVPRPSAPERISSSSTTARMIDMPMPLSPALAALSLGDLCVEAGALILDDQLDCAAPDRIGDGHVARAVRVCVPHGVAACLRDRELQIRE